ncbi:Uu.00g054560.m01.CDS01 [Anthostomella pinea]|uniref:Uu.00g054560.m01.CDS01 n=1 Tax=Anthostomella pinea TaxID=933095 RepID=A0AAI8YPR9_9PEZI|nr:Uu.00g054560.m01.CDS01 [Anthostomella pinea]
MSLRLPGLTLGLAVFASLASATFHEVTVGKGGQLKFDPETLTAQPGDQIRYSFFAKNHAVAQSTFDNPCQIQENAIFSGFTATDSPDVAAPTTFIITVNDTKPLWFYCPQRNGDHCQKGMVQAINAPSSGNTFDAYKAKAQKASTPSTPPVGTLPAGGLRKLHVDVGFNADLVFNPNNVTELVGTVVEFGYNPANHSIVQSSFDAPCQPLESGGFIAPFVRTQQTPSGVTFEVTVTDTKPIWFYCAQTAKTHCQAGMVGSINAAVDGNKTFQAFKDLAAKAPPSTITANTPLVGVLKVNGTLINDVGSAVLNTTALDPSLIYEIPPPGSDYPPYIGGMAGGNQPGDYGWGANITDEAVEFLQILQLLANFKVAILLEGFTKLRYGEWAGAYPASITNTIGSLAAQALIHRRAYTDSLQHYSKDLMSVCQYTLPLDTVDDWLQALLTMMTLSMGANIDIISLAVTSDPWLVPALATALGSEARMTALINLMQNHVASTAPREALMPYQLAASFMINKYAGGGSCDAVKDQVKVFPALNITNKVAQPDGGRLTQVTVEVPSESKGDHWLAWIGAWGGVEYTVVASDGTAPVPDSLSGHVWVVLTMAKDLKVRDIETAAVAGPELVWTAQQWAS